MANTNLYGEDGIVIGLTEDDDICDPTDNDCTHTVTGHAAYACSLQEAKESIRREYLTR